MSMEVTVIETGTANKAVTAGSFQMRKGDLDKRSEARRVDEFSDGEREKDSPAFTYPLFRLLPDRRDVGSHPFRVRLCLKTR